MPVRLPRLRRLIVVSYAAHALSSSTLPRRLSSSSSLHCRPTSRPLTLSSSSPHRHSPSSLPSPPCRPTIIVLVAVPLHLALLADARTHLVAAFPPPPRTRPPRLRRDVSPRDARRAAAETPQARVPGDWVSGDRGPARRAEVFSERRRKAPPARLWVPIEAKARDDVFCGPAHRDCYLETCPLCPSQDRL